LKWRNFLIIFIGALVLLLIPLSYFQSNSNETCKKKHEATNVRINDEYNQLLEDNVVSDNINDVETLIKKI
jgi:hypothetical protein